MYEAEPSPKELLSAYLSNGIYLMCTLVPWTEAIRFYPKDILGGAEDREESHNTRSSVLFAYPYDMRGHATGETISRSRLTTHGWPTIPFSPSPLKRPDA